MDADFFEFLFRRGQAAKVIRRGRQEDGDGIAGLVPFDFILGGVDGGRRGGGLVDGDALQAPEAQRRPEGQGLLQRPDGRQRTDDPVPMPFPDVGLLERQDRQVGAETVPDGVLRGPTLALRRLRPRAVAGVLAVGFDLCGRGHGGHPQGVVGAFDRRACAAVQPQDDSSADSTLSYAPAGQGGELPVRSARFRSQPGGVGGVVSVFHAPFARARVCGPDEPLPPLSPLPPHPSVSRQRFARWSAPSSSMRSRFS